MAVPRSVWLVLLALCAGAAGIGTWLGGVQDLDEGAVILHYADLYATETGQPREDCHAQPGRRADMWLLVLCEGAEGRFAYAVGHDGGLIAFDDTDVTGEEA